MSVQMCIEKCDFFLPPYRSFIVNIYTMVIFSSDLKLI